jgi:hypothetical protein
MVKFLLLIFVGGCLCGCVSEDQKHWERQKEALQIAAEVAEKHGAAWTASIHFRGIGEVYQKIAFGVDTGIDGQVVIHGNAQTEAAEEN